jgi:hypothetical protein
MIDVIRGLVVVTLFRKLNKLSLALNLSVAGLSLRMKAPARKRHQ